MREELSVCEAPIMKIIWESNPDISVPELVKQLNEQYGKEYARTTVVTFLTRMQERDILQRSAGDVFLMCTQ